MTKGNVVGLKVTAMVLPLLLFIQGSQRALQSFWTSEGMRGMCQALNLWIGWFFFYFSFPLVLTSLLITLLYLLIGNHWPNSFTFSAILPTRQRDLWKANLGVCINFPLTFVWILIWPLDKILSCNKILSHNNINWLPKLHRSLLQEEELNPDPWTPNQCIPLLSLNLVSCCLLDSQWFLNENIPEGPKSPQITVLLTRTYKEQGQL